MHVWYYRFETAMMAHGPGKFYYADGQDPRGDTIASRGIFRCAPVANKVPQDNLGSPLRLSEKPVTMMMYFITTLVRACRCSVCVVVVFS